MAEGAETVGELTVKLVGDAKDLAKTNQQVKEGMDAVTMAADKAQAQVNRLTVAHQQLAAAQAQVIAANKAMASGGGGGSAPFSSPWTTGVQTGGHTGGSGYMTSFLGAATTGNAAAVADLAFKKAAENVRLAKLIRQRTEQEAAALDELVEQEKAARTIDNMRRGGHGGGGGHGEHGFLSGGGAWLRAPLRIMDRSMGIGLESMAMSMSGGFGLIAGLGTAFIAVDMLGRAFEGVRQRITALVTKQREYNDTLRDTAIASRDAALNAGASNALMADATNRAAAAEQQRAKIHEEEAARQQAEAESPLTTHFENDFEGVLSNSTFNSSHRQHQLVKDQTDFYAEEQARAQRFADQNMKIQVGRNAADRAAATEAAQIAAMAHGPMQQRLQFENQITTERRKLAEQNQDRLAQQDYDAKAEQRQLQERVDNAQQLLTNLKNVPWALQEQGHSAKVAEAKYQLQEALDAQEDFNARYPTRRTLAEHEAKASMSAFDAQSPYRQLQVERQIEQQRFQLAEEEHAARNQLDDAAIAHRTMGQNREMELMKARHKQAAEARDRELQEMAKTGAPGFAEKLRAAAAQDVAAKLEEQTYQKDKQVELDRTIGDMQDKAAVALRQITPAQAAWNAQARVLAVEYQGMPDKIARIKDAWDAMTAAEANKGLNDQIYDTDLELQRLAGQIDMVTEAYLKMRRAQPNANPDLAMQAAQQQQQLRDAEFHRQTGLSQIDLAVARREMTDLQAEMARLRIQNPGVSENELQRRAALNRSVAAAQFSHNELSRIHPQMQVADYKRQLDEAVRLHQLSKKDSDRLLAQKAYETMGHFDVGEFSGQYRRGQVNVKGINLNPQMSQFDHLVKQTTFLEAIKTNTGLMANKEDLH